MIYSKYHGSNGFISTKPGVVVKEVPRFDLTQNCVPDVFFAFFNGFDLFDVWSSDHSSFFDVQVHITTVKFQLNQLNILSSRKNSSNASKNAKCIILQYTILCQVEPWGLLYYCQVCLKKKLSARSNCAWAPNQPRTRFNVCSFFALFPFNHSFHSFDKYLLYTLLLKSNSHIRWSMKLIQNCSSWNPLVFVL